MVTDDNATSPIPTLLYPVSVSFPPLIKMLSVPCDRFIRPLTSNVRCGFVVLNPSLLLAAFQYSALSNVIVSALFQYATLLARPDPMTPPPPPPPIESMPNESSNATRLIHFPAYPACPGMLSYAAGTFHLVSDRSICLHLVCADSVPVSSSNIAMYLMPFLMV